MTFRIFWLVLSLASLMAMAAQADDLDSGLPESNTNSAAAGAASDTADDFAPDEDDSKILSLSLDESIQLALQNNLDVEVQRFTPLIAGEQETESWGAYDPELFSEFGYSESKEPISFILQEEVIFQGDSYDGFGGFRGLIPYFGSEYSFQFNGERTTTNLPVQAFSPEYRSSFSLSVSQPLLRGLTDLERSLDPGQDIAHPLRRIARKLPTPRDGYGARSRRFLLEPDRDERAEARRTEEPRHRQSPARPDRDPV
jgi:hypothetical protein